MAHKTVVRNKAYQPSSFNTCERHNERKNEEYFNGDVRLDRKHLNVHFKRHYKENGEAETYQETFDRLLDERKIVKHGTKSDAKLFCEMVFDVNTSYFDDHADGIDGYDYAKKFYKEAYRLAVKEAGSEDYIISAVMHADERNSRLSDKLGRDVYHYHLHVIYVPVVEKKLYFRKNNKNPELAGKLKEIIPQISQSNKWPLRMTVEHNGKTVTRNSYSFLQDRYYEHMKEAGFEGFERGERGSTTEHLEVLDYKIQMDKAYAKELAADVEQKQKQITALDKGIEKKQNQLDILDGKITVKDKAVATIDEVDAMGKPALLSSNFNVTADELKKLKTLAKKSVSIGEKLADAKRELKTIKKELETARRDRDIWKNRYNSLNEKIKDFLPAILNFPQKLLEFINRHWRERQQQKSHNLEAVR